MSVRKYLHVIMQYRVLRRHVIRNGGKIDLAVTEKEPVELLLRVEDLLRLGLVHADRLYRLLLLFGLYK